MAKEAEVEKLREELRAQMAADHEAELAAVRRQAQEAQQREEELKRLLDTDTVEAWLARLELGQRARGANGAPAQLQIAQHEENPQVHVRLQNQGVSI